MVLDEAVDLLIYFSLGLEECCVLMDDIDRYYGPINILWKQIDLNALLYNLIHLVEEGPLQTYFIGVLRKCLR